MADDRDEIRLVRVEDRIADHDKSIVRLDQRHRELERRVDALTPLLTSVVTLTVEFKNLREDLAGFMDRVERRDTDREADRLLSRRWVVGLAVALLCALIAATAAIIGGHS